MSRKYLLGCSANDAKWADDVQSRQLADSCSDFPF
jgi:hypothetical protein